MTAAPDPRPGDAVIRRPDGTPLHWSEAAKYRYGLFPGSGPESAAQAIPGPIAAPAEVVPTPPVEPQPPVEPADVVPRSPVEPEPPKRPEHTDRAPWSAGIGVLVIITVLALGGVVIPFSVMNWDSLEWSSWFGDSNTVVTTPTTVVAAEEAPVPDEPAVVEAAAAIEEATPAVGETAPEASSATRTAALVPLLTAYDEDGEASVSYVNEETGLTITTPASWSPVAPDLLADCTDDSTYLTSMAETDGPTLSKVYLNGLVIRVLDVQEGEEIAPGLMMEAVQRFVDEGPETYDYFTVLTPRRESTVGGFYAQTATARITWNERVLVKSVYAFIARDRLYRVELQTDDVDWDDYQDLFENVLDSFVFMT